MFFDWQNSWSPSSPPCTGSGLSQAAGFQAGGVSILLSNTSISQGSANGTTLGAASISGAHTGTPTWSLTDGTGTFQINSSTGVVTVLSNTDLASPGTIAITISASGVSPAPPSAHFTISVVASASPSLDFSQVSNSQYIPEFVP